MDALSRIPRPPLLKFGLIQANVLAKIMQDCAGSRAIVANSADSAGNADNADTAKTLTTLTLLAKLTRLTALTTLTLLTTMRQQPKPRPQNMGAAKKITIWIVHVYCAPVSR